MRTHRPLVSALLLATFALGAPAASAYVLLGNAWDVDNGPIDYSLSEVGSEDIDDGSDLEAVRNAFRSWSCVPGSRIRFLETTAAGPAALNTGDGINSVLWDETGASMAVGPGTLGVTISGPGMGTIDEADIVFNGIDYTWGTDSVQGAVDVESVAIHESGHFLGLGHPCTDQAETDCLGPDQAVMTPALPDGAVIRTPFEDDVNGVLELYPQAEDDESTCDGPFRQGEPCACNDECVAGLRCTQAEGQEFPVCTPNCGSSAAACPTGFSCVLAAREGEGDAEGACVSDDENGLHPPAATCERDSDCQEGLCLATTVVGRRICQVRCDGDGDCRDGYSCTDSVCTGAGASAGLVCPAEPEPDDNGDGCACARPGTSWPAGAVLGGWILLAISRRRKGQP